jgi:hypothetical protein
MRNELQLENGEEANIEVYDSKIIITKPGTVDYKQRVNQAINCIEFDDNGIYTLTEDYTNNEAKDKLQEVYRILKGEK